MNKKRVAELMAQLYEYTFNMFDNEHEVSTEDAGKIAATVEASIAWELVELEYIEAKELEK
jgi:hypothetical protein